MRDTLQRLGLADNTVIVYSADHGIFNGEHGFAGKWYGHEESIRIPLIIHDPRLPAATRGKRCKAMSLNIDLHPTVLESANLSCRLPRRAEASSPCCTITKRTPGTSGSLNITSLTTAGFPPVKGYAQSAGNTCAIPIQRLPSRSYTIWTTTVPKPTTLPANLTTPNSRKLLPRIGGYGEKVYVSRPETGKSPSQRTICSATH